jgi:hypothetical protein
MHRDPGDTAPELYPASYACPLTWGGPVKGPPHEWARLVFICFLSAGNCRLLPKKISCRLKLAITKDHILAARRASEDLPQRLC